MFNSKLLAATIHELGGSATPVVQMGASTDRYNITGVQFEHYQNDHDFLVLVAGSNNLQDRDRATTEIQHDSPGSPEVQPLDRVYDINRRYLLDLLPYQLIHLLSEEDIKRGAMNSDSHELFQPVWDEFPYIELTEDEIQGAFQGAEKLLK